MFPILQYYWDDLSAYISAVFVDLMSFDILLLVDIPYLALGGDYPHQHSADPFLLVVYVLYPMWEQVQVGMTVQRGLAIIRERVKLSRSWRNDHRCWRNCSWIILDIMRHVTSVGFICFQFELVDGSLSWDLLFWEVLYLLDDLAFE